MYYCYILHNLLIDKYYIGATSNLENRIKEHNSSEHKSKFTRRNKGEWKLVYCEQFYLKEEAYKREKQIKKWKSRKMINKLINDENVRSVPT